MFKLPSLFLGLTLISVFTTGCSIDSSLFGVKEIKNETAAETPGAEFVSGSTQYQQTAHGYHVSASAGSVYDKLTGTTASGYKVYMTVQGQMISEDAH